MSNFTAKSGPFDEHAIRYDEWFDRHPCVYDAELRAVRKALPARGRGVEIGVGSGRFALPLGISAGVEPSEKMRALARARGIDALSGVAERLPFADAMFDFVLFVTTICFLDDVGAAFREAHRVLKKGGAVVVGFVEKHGRLGREYEEKKAQSIFYREAEFRSAEELVSLLKKAGFKRCVFYQTLFGTPERVTADEPVRRGRGEGSFLVVKARKGGGTCGKIRGTR
ncbi:MAG: class I SAM-dependent methyltransferase [Spirochaetales bacterium]|nr:class I SAM-dependent methyltransferase [Spirochaetales bacterium]